MHLAASTVKVFPTKSRGWTVVPLSRPGTGPTVLDTFRVDPVAKLLDDDAALGDLFGAERWLDLVKERVDRELVYTAKRSTFTQGYRRRQDRLDSAISDLRSKPPVARIELAEDHRAAIRANLKRSEDSVVVSRFFVDFRVRDLRTLVSPNWLNDEVINFYCQLLMERSKQCSGKFPSMHAFSSFFFPKLRDHGYEGVRTATRKLDPPALARDLLLVPIHLGMHWCMAAIDLRAKSITYYDSLHGDNPTCLGALRKWIMGEFAERQGGQPFDFTRWTESCPKDIPAQHNGYDCGVFALAFAEHLGRDAAFDFSQIDMPYWRDRISFEILSGRLLEH